MSSKESKHDASAMKSEPIEFVDVKTQKDEVVYAEHEIKEEMVTGPVVFQHVAHSHVPRSCPEVKGDIVDDMNSEEASRISRQGHRRRRILEPVAVASSETPFTSPVRKRKSTTLSVGEQEIVINVYKFVKNTWPGDMYPSNEKMIEKTSQVSGVSKRTIYRVLASYRDTRTVLEKGIIKKRKKSIIDKLNDFDKSAIRRKAHQFFLAGELPTLDKILQSINQDDQLPNSSETSLRRVLRHLKFKYIRRGRNSVLIDRPEIVVWRTRYLEEVQKLRNEGRRIFYLDETWLDVGHTVGKVCENANIQSAHRACSEGLPTASKNSTGKGLTVAHIGNDEGFLEGCEWVFESSVTTDHHERMDAPHFEEWFGKVLEKLRSGDVIVMDDASYHSRQLEKIPTISWKKQSIQKWLESKQIVYAPSDKKAHLVQKVIPFKHNYQSFISDEMAKKRGSSVVRLPPHHCEFNPIELEWVHVKDHVTRNKTTLKLPEVKKLLTDGLARITPDRWKNCVQHVLKVEERMSGIDDVIDQTADGCTINPADSSTESSTNSEDSSGDTE